MRFVAGAADHRNDPPGRSHPFTKRAQQKLSRIVRTAARRKYLGPLLSLRGFPGRLRVGQLLEMPPRWRSPPLSRRGAWRGERKVFPCCSAAAACAALTRGLLAGGSAPLGHEQGEGFIGSILECASFHDGFVPPGVDPDLGNNAASFALSFAQSLLPLTGLGCWIKRRRFWATGTALFRR